MGLCKLHEIRHSQVHMTRLCTWVKATAGISTVWGMKGSRAALCKGELGWLDADKHIKKKLLIHMLLVLIAVLLIPERIIDSQQ